MLGTYGTYQYFSEDTPAGGMQEGGGLRSRLTFENDSAQATLMGPPDAFHKSQAPIEIVFEVHRDRTSDAVLLEIQGQKILLRAGEWSRWTELDFAVSTPKPIPNQHASGICRFLVQEMSPNFRLYVSPINVNPSAPAVQLSEPDEFVEDISEELGLFYTTGFQEDHKARTNGVFNDDDYRRQATQVLEERLALFEYAVENYEDGLLFFYFSSSDLQSHIFWWDGVGWKRTTSFDEQPGSRQPFSVCQRPVSTAGCNHRGHQRSIRWQIDDHCDERSRFCKFRSAVQLEHLVARPQNPKTPCSLNV